MEKFITKKLIEQGYLSNDLNSWIVRIRFNGIILKLHLKNIFQTLLTLNLNT